MARLPFITGAGAVEASTGLPHRKKRSAGNGNPNHICYHFGEYSTKFNMWVFPKILVLPPKSSSFVHRVFPYFHHPFWGTSIFGNTHVKKLLDATLSQEIFSKKYISHFSEVFFLWRTWLLPRFCSLISCSIKTKYILPNLAQKKTKKMVTLDFISSTCTWDAGRYFAWNPLVKGGSFGPKNRGELRDLTWGNFRIIHRICFFGCLITTHNLTGPLLEIDLL